MVGLQLAPGLNFLCQQLHFLRDECAASVFKFRAYNLLPSSVQPVGFSPALWRSPNSRCFCRSELDIDFEFGNFPGLFLYPTNNL